MSLYTSRNALIVRTHEGVMEKLKTLITELDILREQVFPLQIIHLMQRKLVELHARYALNEDRAHLMAISQVNLLLRHMVHFSG